jgi:hypothetical protein
LESAVITVLKSPLAVELALSSVWPTAFWLGVSAPASNAPDVRNSVRNTSFAS